MTLRNFDEALVKLVGKIPKGFYKPFLWLGRFTTPVLWASYVVLIYSAFLTPGKLEGDVIVVLALIPLASVIKLFFRRKRPPTLYVEGMKIKSYSFPSSHAYSASLVLGHFAIVSMMTNLLPLSIFLIVIAASIGISRVGIGAHYPSDVIAGWVLGTVAVSVSSLL